MKELRDISIHQTAVKLSNAMKNTKMYDGLYEMVQNLACSPEVDKSDMKCTLENAIKSSGLAVEIRNMVYHLVRNSLKPEVKAITLSTPTDSLTYLRRAGIQWERRVRKSLNAMCNELEVTLQGEPRTQQDKEELFNKWDQLSNYQVDLSNYRPVYAPKDLLEILLSLKGAPHKQEECSNNPKWEFSHINLPVKNLNHLRLHYSDLLRQEYRTVNWPQLFQKVVQEKHAPVCQHLLKKGQTPIQCRGALWSCILGSEVQPCHQEHWDKLRTSVLNTDLILDKLVIKDIQLTATNDDQYFVFEDVLYQIMLCFSRDTEIASLIAEQSVNGSQSSGTTSSKFQTKQQYDIPPSGIVPFHGICMFAAPFCYLYHSPADLYCTFRAFYVRYCHQLITINLHPQGIVSLCLLFEKLLQTHEPELWSHFRELQIQPLRIVFKWLMRAFSGHLPPNELLILWDLILGYDSLEIIPFLAIIIMSFRKESLMQVHTLDNIENVLADLSSIKILPLIQLSLAKE